MDIMTLDDIKNLDYNTFDVTRLWKAGTFKTVTVGRLVLDEIPDSYFSSTEMSAFIPANLVPGIPGPADHMFKGRRLAYRDAHNYRLVRNQNRIDVNSPKGRILTYTRDSDPPVRENIRDAPSFFPNSFNGPVLYIEPSHPSQKLVVYDNNIADFGMRSIFITTF
ncbi:unnamed protein product [Diatraea saccharalis]|uniref:Catalase core domain-containing protein n=1 Tax=Diatraea saccharalis TaxID=40085 RepID=A0A9N9WDV8_9NEOP|nr:unnamed protein product [Diatraea saccharalis]